jgi:hypothetical protein
MEKSVRGLSTLHVSGEQTAVGSPSPPLEERVGERMPTIRSIRRFVPTLQRAHTAAPHASIAEKDGLLSLSLSSKGGEGKQAVACEH